MLKCLQGAYAGQPVKFLLFPCNQFGSQEPKANSEIKAFAEKSVKLGAGSDVVMFAKSNLNDVKCTTTGKDTCTAASAECCPSNDPIYKYLLEVTPPGQIQWNFDKIVVNGAGQPYSGESILHGGDEVSEAISAADPNLKPTQYCSANLAASSTAKPTPTSPFIMAATVIAFGSTVIAFGLCACVCARRMMKAVEAREYVLLQ